MERQTDMLRRHFSNGKTERPI